MDVLIREGMWLPRPTLTEQNLPDQSGKVFIVTGGYSGVGWHLSKILYQRNGVVYIAGRRKDKFEEAVAEMKKECPSSIGRLEHLHLDLSDLPTIAKTAQDFMAKEDRLDVLTNNAGVMVPPAGSKTKQGYELQMGTNCLGPYLLTKCLLPILAKTAASSPLGSVRVTWAASSAVNLAAPRNGVVFEGGSPKVHGIPSLDYAQSKAGNVLLSAELARRFKDNGIIGLSFNPGNLRSELQRHLSAVYKAFVYAICYPPVNGAYTELYAGWSDNISLEESGSYVIPWGRIAKPASHILPALQEITHGGTGVAKVFWEWCDKETSPYLPSKSARA